MPTRINCIYNNSGAWCMNEKVKVGLFGSRRCIEYFRGVECKFKEKHKKPIAPPPPPPKKRAINEDVKLCSKKKKEPVFVELNNKHRYSVGTIIKSEYLKNFISSSPCILLYMEKFADIEESGNWCAFPNDFNLLLRIYRDNKKAVEHLKATLRNARAELNSFFDD